MERFVVGVDIGSTGGSLVLFLSDTSTKNDTQNNNTPLRTTTVTVSEYSGSFDRFTDTLAEKIQHLIGSDPVEAIGVASTGIYNHEGCCVKASTVPMLEGNNIPLALEDRLNIPVAVGNDADAGGLGVAEVVGGEFLYLVMGGGLGGAWISEGTINYASRDCHNIHPTSEPGHVVSFPIEMLKTVLSSRNGDYVVLDENLRQASPADRIFDDSATGIRAGRVVSGHGLFRLFRSVAGEKYPDIDDPATAGEKITGLRRFLVEEAIDTYDIFSRLLAYVANEVVKTATTGSRREEPLRIYIGGKPAQAFHYFAPAAQGFLTALYDAPARLLRTPYNDGRNANLIGAAVLARRLMI